MKFYRAFFVLILGVLATFSGVASASPSPASAYTASVYGEGGTAGPESELTCNTAGNGNTISVKSCSYNITVWMNSGCIYGHFMVWNKHNTAQYRNSNDASKCSSLGVYGMGTAWSNDTCATFYRLDNGVYTKVGDNPCNNDN
ncbi:hypothetical protein [Actinokineospora globicatena]|uniref:Secreted protein n=1 Tax=Actinokineospora globicatena TaxID=103729 RepID=A0A9W6QQJ1_9PSEU|nr:hypothetical protein [Actinokineospora globicatena]GLW94688.1 hypothetical protein Aglo03_55040 [Actinokineospora globicatena]